MEAQFNLSCLTSNGISINSSPDLKRKVISLIFEDGEVHELVKSSGATERRKVFVWADESCMARYRELKLGNYEKTRGNPLLARKQVKTLSEIDAEIDEIISFYNEE